MKKFFLTPIVVALCIALGATPVYATAGLVDGIWFSHDTITDFGDVTVYSVVRNQTDTDVQGIATLVVDGTAVNVQEVKVKPKGITRIGIDHTFTAGAHTVGISFTAGGGLDIDLNELPQRNIFVVADSDGDGIQDTTDPDDDNDGIPDVEDAEPLVKQVLPPPEVSLSDSGKALLDSITGRFNSDSEEVTKDDNTPVVSTTTDDSSSESAITTVVSAVEDARKRGAAALREYESQQRAALEEIEAEEEALAAVDGFEPPASQESKKREHQIAAVSASVAGTMLEKGWLFYSELIVLTLGISHLVVVWFRERFSKVEEEAEE